MQNVSFKKSLAEHYLEKSLGVCAFHQTQSKSAVEMKSAQLPVLALVYKEHQASHFAGIPVLKHVNSHFWLLHQELK